ncbi:MAG: DUF4845 domain-containing protein [Pseudomonadales bacterium]
MKVTNHGMKRKTKQRGAIDLVVIFAVMFGAILVISAIKIFPMYMDHWTVEEALQDVLDDAAGNDSISKRKLSSMLFRRLEVNRIDFIDEESVVFDRTKTDLTATLDYERRSSLFGNMDVVLKFPEVTFQSARSGG